MQRLVKNKAGPPKQPKTLDLEQSIPVLLSFLSSRMTSTGSATYRRHLGLGLVEWKVMSMLAIQPGISGNDVAQVIGLDKAAVSRTVKALEKRGLAASNPSNEHSGRRLDLTPAGLALHDQAVLLAFERERLLLNGFSQEERRLLISFLQRMLGHIAALHELARDASPSS